MRVTSSAQTLRLQREPARNLQPQLRVVRPDGFVGQARAERAVSSPYSAQIDRLFRENVGRAPTAEEVRRYDDFAKTLQPDQIEAGFTWVIRSGPEWQARSVAQAELGRDPTADELQNAITWGNQLVSEGKSTGEMRGAFEYVTRLGSEWQARSVSLEELGRLPTADEQRRAADFGADLVAQGKTTAEVRDVLTYCTRLGPEWQSRSAYQDMLGRLPTADEQQRMTEWGETLVAEGKQTPDVRAAFNYVIAQTPEWQEFHRPDAVRAQVAEWAIAQANDPNIGYSQTAGRFGERVDENGHRYFDCSGLVTAAYEQAGVHLGGNWTGAMQDSWPQWADQVPKDLSQMKPGDLLLMNGHVVMYTGDGQCVGAQTSHGDFQDQVRTGIDAAGYLALGDCIVIRPRV